MRADLRIGVRLSKNVISNPSALLFCHAIHSNPIVIRKQTSHARTKILLLFLCIMRVYDTLCLLRFPHSLLCFSCPFPLSLATSPNYRFFVPFCTLLFGFLPNCNNPFLVMQQIYCWIVLVYCFAAIAFYHYLLWHLHCHFLHMHRANSKCEY